MVGPQAQAQILWLSMGYCIYIWPFGDGCEMHSAQSRVGLSGAHIPLYGICCLELRVLWGLDIQQTEDTF